MRIIDNKMIMDEKFLGFSCFMQFEKYVEGNRLRMELRDTEDLAPVAVCTINLPDQKLSENCVFIKDYSENEGVSSYLVSEGIIYPYVYGIVRSGHVHIYACRLTEEVIDFIEPLNIITS